MNLLFSLLLVSVFPKTTVAGKHNLAWEQCSREELIHTVDTQAVITGLFSVRKRSEDGSSICGEISEQGLQNLEAVRWVLGLLNQDYDLVFGQRVSTSFVPGIRIGMIFYEINGIFGRIL